MMDAMWISRRPHDHHAVGCSEILSMYTLGSVIDPARSVTREFL